MNCSEKFLNCSEKFLNCSEKSLNCSERSQSKVIESLNGFTESSFVFHLNERKVII
jgi:hypothetical protein